MPKIDMNKEYTTRNGREVRIYATDGRGSHPVHGAVKHSYGWIADIWTLDGKHEKYALDEAPLDLIEKPKTVRVQGYVNVYPDRPHSGLHKSRRGADSLCRNDRIACIKIDMEVEEGWFDD